MADIDAKAKEMAGRNRAATMGFDWRDLPDDALIPAVPLLRDNAALILSQAEIIAELRRETEWVHVGWRWRLPADDKWQFVDGVQKPRLGLPASFEEKAIKEPVYAALARAAKEGQDA